MLDVKFRPQLTTKELIWLRMILFASRVLVSFADDSLAFKGYLEELTDTEKLNETAVSAADASQSINVSLPTLN